MTWGDEKRNTVTFSDHQCVKLFISKPSMLVGRVVSVIDILDS